MLRAHVVKTRRQLVIDVSLDLPRGGAIALLGASGAGKSTVLACLAGLAIPDHGSVTLGKARLYPPSLPAFQRRIGYLTQDPGLFPHLRVHENVTFGLTSAELRHEETTSWIETLRDRLQLASIWHASAPLISGGQARRVALARTLARKPRLMLLDEPFAGLDRQLIRELVDDLVFWNRTLGFSMIVVDHHVEVLRRLCPDGAIALEQGSVVQRGSWDELYREPATPLLQSLLSPL